jgi:hypothetical protein
MKIGIIELFKSSKGTLCVMVLSAMTVLAFLGKLDPNGVSFSAGCTLISAIFCWTQHKTDIATLASKEYPQNYITPVIPPIIPPITSAVASTMTDLTLPHIDSPPTP